MTFSVSSGPSERAFRPPCRLQATPERSGSWHTVAGAGGRVWGGPVWATGLRMEDQGSERGQGWVTAGPTRGRG